MGSEQAIVRVEHLSKTFRVGLLGKTVQAVKDVSFEVQAGQVLGYLGPNGSGKTTSIKCMLGLIQPSGGSIELFGHTDGALQSRARIGYMPEHPYFYDYLKPTEVLDYVGRLYGIEASVRKKRVPALLERLGLGHAMDRTLRGFSKGMLQRCGIAQSLMSDPDLLVFDEPLSGLDPVGRKELRDLMAQLRSEGKSLFITSHVLSDIEALCDAVVILDRGETVAKGELSTLLRADRLESEASLSVPGERAIEAIVALEGVSLLRADAGSLKVALPSRMVEVLVAKAAEVGASLVGLSARRDTLEELFMRKAVHVDKPLAEAVVDDVGDDDGEAE